MLLLTLPKARSFKRSCWCRSRREAVLHHFRLLLLLNPLAARASHTRWPRRSRFSSFFANTSGLSVSKCHCPDAPDFTNCRSLAFDVVVTAAVAAASVSNGRQAPDQKTLTENTCPLDGETSTRNEEPNRFLSVICV